MIDDSAITKHRPVHAEIRLAHREGGASDYLLEQLQHLLLDDWSLAIAASIGVGFNDRRDDRVSRVLELVYLKVARGKARASESSEPASARDLCVLDEPVPHAAAFNL